MTNLQDITTFSKTIDLPMEKSKFNNNADTLDLNIIEFTANDSKCSKEDLNNKPTSTDSYFRKITTLDRLNNKNKRASVITVSTIDHERSFIQNDLLKGTSSFERKKSKDSQLFCEPQEVKHKQPIMGKTALLRKSLVDPSDSGIIHSLILNKYENVLNYYVSRMNSRRSSRISVAESESSETNVDVSPADLSSIDTLDIKDQTPVNKKIITTNNMNDDSSIGTLDNVPFDCSGDFIDVTSTYSEFDPRKFLVDALGDVAGVGLCNCSSTTHKCQESIGSSRISSLLSARQSEASPLLRNSRQKQSKKCAKIESNENINLNFHLEKLKIELSKQHSIIFQISKALNYCKTTRTFITGNERLEAERILLMATITKEALVNEINMLEFDTYQYVLDSRCIGEIQLSEINFYLKEKTDIKRQDCEEYLLLLVKCGKTVLTSGIIKKINNTIYVDKTFIFSGIQSDFEISVGVYYLGMKSKDCYSQETNKCPSPKSLLKCRKHSKSYKATNLIHTETTAFNPLGKCHIKSSDLLRVDTEGNVTMKWCQMASSSFLQAHYDLKIQSSFKLTNQISGFLTLGVENGVLTWNRRWCVLEGSVFKYWNYPSEELTEPIDFIDMKDCTVQKIILADRSVCARPKTLYVPIKKPQGIRNYFLSADNQSELKLWENELNFVVQSLIQWNSMNRNLY